MTDFLYTAQGKDFLQKQYIEACRSTYDIADELDTYANKIRRALLFHGFSLRDKSQAQQGALNSGRATHPTEGTKRPQATKIQISNSMANMWTKLSKKEKEARSKIAKDIWQQMSEIQKEKLRQDASKGIRRAAHEGSELEKYIMKELVDNGFLVEFHKEFLTTRETTHVDMFLPEINIAIEVDGPSHFLPIWGEENLKRIQHTDNTKNGLLLEKGLVVIRVKQMVKNISQIYKRKVSEKVVEIVQQIKRKFPPSHERLIILEA